MKRTIAISSPSAHLSLKHGQCVVSIPAAAPVSIPIEDLQCILVETPAATITTACLVALAENNASVVTCDSRHLPIAVQLPLYGNTLHTQRLREQASMSKPLAKQLWKRLITTKIRGQARVVASRPARRRLLSLAERVRSGDPENLEGQAARVYWRGMFGQDFRRDRFGDGPNPLLNYGYAVLRATVARALTMSGLHPSLGLAHSNRSNPFVLADDMIEPWRPWIDQCVAQLWQQSICTLTHEAKDRLLRVFQDPVELSGRSMALMDGVEASCASLVHALSDGSSGVPARAAARRLQLPGVSRLAA